MEIKDNSLDFIDAEVRQNRNIKPTQKPIQRQTSKRFRKSKRKVGGSLLLMI